VLVTDELLGFHLEDGRFISVPLAFYPTLALATPEEPEPLRVSGSSVYWPDRMRTSGLRMLAGARNIPFYARKAVERAVHLGRLPKTALEKSPPAPPNPLRGMQTVAEATGHRRGASMSRVLLTTLVRWAISTRSFHWFEAA